MGHRMSEGSIGSDHSDHDDVDPEALHVFTESLRQKGLDPDAFPANGKHSVAHLFKHVNEGKCSLVENKKDGTVQQVSHEVFMDIIADDSEGKQRRLMRPGAKNRTQLEGIMPHVHDDGKKTTVSLHKMLRNGEDWEDAVDASLTEKLKIPYEMQTEIFNIDPSKVKETQGKPTPDPLRPGLSTVCKIVQVYIEVRDPKHPGMAHMGMPGCHEFALEPDQDEEHHFHKGHRRSSKKKWAWEYMRTEDIEPDQKHDHHHDHKHDVYNLVSEDRVIEVGELACNGDLEAFTKIVKFALTEKGSIANACQNFIRDTAERIDNEGTAAANALVRLAEANHLDFAARSSVEIDLKGLDWCDEVRGLVEQVEEGDEDGSDALAQLSRLLWCPDQLVRRYSQNLLHQAVQNVGPENSQIHAPRYVMNEILLLVGIAEVGLRDISSELQTLNDSFHEGDTATSWVKRRGIVNGLGQALDRNNTIARDKLLRMWQDDNWTVREAVVTEFGKHVSALDKDTMHAIWGGIFDKHAPVREATTQTLGRVCWYGVPEIVSDIMVKLDQNDVPASAMKSVMQSMDQAKAMGLPQHVQDMKKGSVSKKQKSHSSLHSVKAFTSGRGWDPTLHGHH